MSAALANRGTRSIGALVAGVLLSLTACDTILDIPRATVDPTLSVGQAGASGASAGAAGSSGADPCVLYCDTIAASCTGLNAEYISRDVCMAVCQTFDVGQPGDQAVDSLSCRMRHATLAATDPIVHCQQAGPLGAGGCADPCTPFCVLTYNLCNPAGLFPYADVKTCRKACASFTYLSSAEPANAGAAGDIIFLSGDTLNCRIYHLESAYNPNDAHALKVHCPHTAVDSATCN